MNRKKRKKRKGEQKKNSPMQSRQRAMDNKSLE